MTYIAAESMVMDEHFPVGTTVGRRVHIEVARKLSKDLRSAAMEFELRADGSIPLELFWDSMQPSPVLKQRFAAFLDDLHFDGIRSRFFGEFDADKLILPVAAEIARRLDALADDLEEQLGRRTWNADTPEDGQPPRFRDEN